MKWMALLLPLRIVLLVIVAFVVWQALVFARPRPREFTVGEVKALRAACEQVANLCARQAPPPVRCGVAHLVHDPTDVATMVLRDTLAARTGWTIEQGSVIRKFLHDISRAVGQATTLDEVLHAGRRVELDVVVAGRVLAVETTNDTARAALQIYAYDVRRSAWLLKDTVTGEWRPGAVEQLAARVRGARPLTKLAIWLVVVLALPWATAFATHWALEKRSNLASFIVVGSYTLLDMILAVALAGFTVVGSIRWFKLLLAFVFAGGYNFWACERIAKRQVES